MTATLERPVAVATRSVDRDPSWVRPALIVLLLATGALYTWDLAASGYANSFYAAAVQAGSHSWKAMLFGSSDAASFITVDKPPAALWVMDLSARVFGFNSWSMLVPQALEGVASVWLLYATGRRIASPAAGLLAGVALATTPVAVLMFRFNNPDSLLVLCLIGSVYATTRALESASTRWLSLAGALIGIGFLTKMLQAVVLVPVLAAVYLYASPAPLPRRIRQLLVAGLSMVAAAGWWIGLVSLWPAGSRPYIGGSQGNSILELTLGYNGFGRLTGNETGSVGGGGGTGSGRWGATGLLRMFNSEFGGQVSWLIPAALVLLGGGIWATWSRARTDALRAGFLLWGGWLLLTGLTFSLAKGIIHPYYSVALAPAIAALVGLGTATMWSHRSSLASRGVLAGAVIVTVSWTYHLMIRSSWHSSLAGLLLFGGLVAAAALLWLPLLDKRFALGVAALALVTSMVAPAVAAVETASQAHSGAIPSAAPSSGSGPGGMPGGRGRGGGGFGGGGGIGNLLNASTPSAELVAALKANASSYTWVAAAIGSNSAAGPQLATGLPVMAIGGFNGSDPTPTLAAFQALVAQGKIHYFLGGGTGTSSGTGAQITAWVQASFTAVALGGTTVYDLTS